jgi:hydroxymethylpyrimidine/phosphomethylpyrimidine kinase
MIELPTPRIETKNTHGTGCTLSSAIAALLPQRAGAHSGTLRAVEAAVRDARAYLLRAIASADALDVGSGHGPVHHFHAFWPRQSS